MHSAQEPYRELLSLLHDCASGDALEPTVRRWLAANTAEIAWLQTVAVAGPSPRSVPAMPVEDLWRLYALSRVSDALIALTATHTRPARAYIAFMAGLGLQRITAEPAAPFHPFYHEIVTVTPAPATAASPDLAASAPIALTSTHWPGFLCGPLLIARAGVGVTGGTQHLRKEIAETSTLYWCHRRSGRPTQDLSVGWGSNSQWRTAFRRDYCLAGQLHYNVDGQSQPDDDLDLTDPEKTELLRHRCFIVSARTHEDLFPYHLRHMEPLDPVSRSH